MKRSAELPEEELVIRAQNGDSEAFYSLYLRYEKGLYSLCFHLLQNQAEAEDAVQEAVLKAYSHIKDFKGREGIPFSAWLYRICANTCFSLLRRRKESLLDPKSDHVAETPDPQPGPLEQVLLMEEGTAVRQAVAALPDIYRLPVLLRYGQGLSYAEIGQILDLPVNTVATRLRRAHFFLKKQLAGKEDEAN